MYERVDGFIYMHKSPRLSSNPSIIDFETRCHNQVTFSFKFKHGNNANSKDIFGKIGTSDDYLVANLRKSNTMDAKEIKGVLTDALDMALHYFGKSKVKGINASWAKNKVLYPNLPDNKSLNLLMYEKAVKTMTKEKAVFETITGKYAKSRGFTKVLEIKEYDISRDGFYGIDVIFAK